MATSISAGSRPALRTRGPAQVKAACDWAVTGGFVISVAGLLVFLLTLVQALFQVQGWSGKLSLVVEGLIWSSLIGAAGALLIVLSQALRCLYDLTYRTVAPLDEA